MRARAFSMSLLLTGTYSSAHRVVIDGRIDVRSEGSSIMARYGATGVRCYSRKIESHIFDLCTEDLSTPFPDAPSLRDISIIDTLVS